MSHEVTKNTFTDSIVEEFEITEYDAEKIVELYDTTGHPYTFDPRENIAKIEEDEYEPEMVEALTDNSIEDYIAYNLKDGFIMLILK